jgi:DNA polymerase III alpha subunit
MIRTGYSFKTAVGHLPEVLARIKEIELPKAPIADRLSTFGFVKWTKLCAQNEIQPVYGVELACVPELGIKRPTPDYWCFLAIDNVKALHDLVWMATRNPDKEPALTYAQAMSAEGVVKITGERLLLDRLPGPHIPRNDFYFGLSPATSRGLYNAAKAAGLPMVAMNCNTYTNPQDREFYRVAIGWRSSGQSYPQHILSDPEWNAAMARFVSDQERHTALFQRDAILEQCNATLEKATLLTPAKPMTLRAMCEAGAAELGCDLTRPVYKARLDRELDMIATKQFEDYFYIVADLVQYAKANMVVGPGRGSSSGSLVCYLLKITAIDPIPFGLLFERFIDITRNDLPDIDIDFSDERRQMVFDYAESKYGAERVARLGTVGTFKPRAALNQAGEELGIPRWRVEKVFDSLILRSSGDSRANQQLEDSLNETQAGRELLRAHPEIVIAARLEAHPNNASQHAAGLLMTEQPVRNYVAVDARTKAAMCDKKDAEVLNLLKIDALGLKQLSIFERTLELLGKPQRCGWLESLPLNDPAAFEVLNRGHFAGIFQFTGRSLKNLVRQSSGVENFDDMVAITALARPGPMGTGGAGAWARRRAGKEAITYPHALLEPYLNETLGQMVYQEQIMKVGKEFGDLSWADVTAMRKAMSKSLGEEYFDQFGDRWKTNVIAKGLPPEIAKSFWADLCRFGLYGFNKSHAVAYAVVSYWCCYLKAHHPLEFAAATLDAEDDPATQIELLRELEVEGVEYKPVDAAHSTAKWTPVYGANTRKLVGPLTNVKGIGPASVHEILKARTEGKPLRPALERKLNNAKTPLDSLYPVRDRIRQLIPDFNAAGIVSTPMQIAQVQSGVAGEVVVIAVVSKIAPRDENEAVNVAKRGGRIYTDGMTQSLNMFFKDDSGEIFAKINRFDWHNHKAQEIIDRGRSGTAIYVLKGPVPHDFRMIKINKIKYIGDMEAELPAERAEQPEQEAAE